MSSSLKRDEMSFLCCTVMVDVHSGSTFWQFELVTRLRSFNFYVAGGFTNDHDKMYDTRRGTGPFGIKSPVFPFGYEEGSKFSLPQVDL